MYTVGIDMGSKEIKIALLDTGEVKARAARRGGFEQAPIAQELLEQTLTDAGVARSDVAHVTATGMGAQLAPFADSKVTDVTAAAVAAARLFPGTPTIIEVGAEESRAIRSDGAGRVLDSAVNGKCAAGSGSFTESMARALEMTLEEFASSSLESTEKIPMNAQCTVFAESEVVSLIHQGTETRDIARAVHDAIAARVGALVRRVGLEGTPVFLGGLALSPGFRKSIADNLGLEELLIPEHPAYADALGAALIAARRAEKAASTMENPR